MSTELWMGTEGSFHQLMSMKDQVAQAPESLLIRASEWEDDSDEYGLHWMVQLSGKIAVVTVSGPMEYGRAGFWGMYFGYCGYDDIKEALMSAYERGATDYIMIWDTPGGSVKGIEDASQFMKEFKKQENFSSMTSHTSTECSSAGLWLATEADKFYCSPMGKAGSLGVFGVHREVTENMRMLGIKATIFRIGEHKGLGNPFEKLSDEAKRVIEEDMRTSNGFFIEAISTNLGLPRDYVETELATGDVWYGAEAHQKRIVDGVMYFTDVFVALSKKTNENTGNYQSRPTEVDMKNRKLTTQMAAAIAAGAPVDTVLENTEVEQEDPNTGAVEGDPKESVEGDEPADNPEVEAEASDKGVKAVLAATENLTNQLVDAKVKLSLAESKLQEMQTAMSGMVEVVAVATQRAFVGVGSPAPDLAALKAMDPTALLTQYSNAQALLEKKYPTGGRISSQVEEGAAEDLSVESQLRAHNEEIRLRLATLKPQTP